MIRLLTILAIIPIIAAFVVRWWFGMRLLSGKGRHQCRCDLAKWEKTFGPQNIPPSSNGDALIYATLLRKSSLLDWKTRDPRASASREGARRFGMAVPPLALMVALLAVIVGRLPIIYLLPVFLLAIASAVIISYLSIAPELKAILINSRRLRDSHTFPRREDEEAVIEVANALAWKEAAPPVFNLLQK
ncbi:hypothetical protein [Luteolibacter sp. AS25]|uniref:hypothetical protein n=1 Tax=Luteolibacter sp. AS25 TaxID=3135776 RepID=UPI00398B62E6